MLSIRTDNAVGCLVVARCRFRNKGRRRKRILNIKVSSSRVVAVNRIDNDVECLTVARCGFRKKGRRKKQIMSIKVSADRAMAVNRNQQYCRALISGKVWI